VPDDSQLQDIEQEIKNLVLHFIKNPNSIIFTVIKVDTDPATSESLHNAKSVDSNSNHTIYSSVVTKLDVTPYFLTLPRVQIYFLKEIFQMNIE